MSSAAISYLQKLLEPYRAEDFLDSSWGQSHRYIRGWPGKFSTLLPWTQLNEILRRHRLDFPRLRLMQDGQSLPTASYLRHATAARRRTPIPRLKPASLTKHLREGATLVLDAVDELYEPLTELAEGLELVFREHVQINSYAGWRTSRGFDLHWDDHDVFILQVGGRKRWSVYGMTAPHPLAGDSQATNPRPEGEPLWEGTLEDGDLLYMPRGCWHVALPLDEPTLHLTVGVHNRTGLDLLRWLSERLRASEVFRKDLPRFASDAAKSEHLSSLRQELLSAWDEKLLERFYGDYDAMAEPRARLSLPWSATPGILPRAGATVVRLTAPRPLALSVEDGVVQFSCQKKRWRFAADAALVLRPLAARRICTVSELCEEAAPRLDETTVRALLCELILHGLVAVAEG